MAVLPNIPCPKDCRIVGQLLFDHALSYALTATADVPANVIQYPRFTKLIIANLLEKYKSIPKRLEEDYYTIKNDTPLVNVYTVREVTVRGMLIPNDLPTNVIKDTQAYKNYVEKYGGVEVPMIQLEPVESTQGMHRKSRATRTPNLDVVQKRKRKGKQIVGESSSPKASLKIRIMQQKHKTARVYEEQQDVAAVKKKILEENAKKLVEGEEESIGSDFADTVLLSDEDSGNRLEPRSHKENPKEVDDDDKAKDDKLDEDKDDNKDDDDNDNDDDHNDHLLIKTRKTGSSEIKTEKMQTPIPHSLDPLGLTYLRIRQLIRN
ncbi:hypothetical protein Tco_0369055 [Tanacetum coccineum]